jgi:hypothetical protein
LIAEREHVPISGLTPEAPLTIGRYSPRRVRKLYRQES